MSRVAPSLPPEPVAANSNDWWCDVAGTGCQRPRPGKYLPSRHYKDRNFFVCEVCYAGGPLALKLHTVRATSCIGSRTPPPAAQTSVGTAAERPEMPVARWLSQVQRQLVTQLNSCASPRPKAGRAFLRDEQPGVQTAPEDEELAEAFADMGLLRPVDREQPPASVRAEAERILSVENTWWCDIAAEGCERPQEGSYAPARHWRGDATFFVCEACYMAGYTKAIERRVFEQSVARQEERALDKARVAAAAEEQED